MRAEALLWLVGVEAFGLAALPVTLRVFRRLPDRGYGFSKVLGLLLVAYLIWLPGMLGYLDYRRATVVCATALVAAAGWFLWGGETARWADRSWRVIATEEVIFLVAGLLGASVRAYNADINGQEKFMDLAFFNGFLQAGSLPAEDTWMSGYAMPYYPFGYLLYSVPTKLSGLPAAYGYNLALVLVFALTFLLVAALVADLASLLRATGAEQARAAPTAGCWALGLAGAALVALCGNLVGPLEVLAARGWGSPAFWSTVGVKNLTAVAGGTGWWPPDGGWWWHASRVIATIQPDGITEFPYFSFLLGDLHPHFTALPTLLLIVGLVVELLLKGAPRGAVVTGVAALPLGVPLAANTWDAATFWLLYGLAALAVGWRAQADRPGLDWRPFWRTLMPLPLGLMLFLPYFIGYSSQRLGLALVPDRTPLVSFLIIQGPMLLAAGLLGWRLLRRPGLGTWRLERLIEIVLVLLVAGLTAVGSLSAALALSVFGLLALALARNLDAWRRGGPAEAAALSLLGVATVGTAVLVGVEFVYIHDSFGTRMNTVFKFYYHVWLLLGLAAAPALGLWLGRSLAGRPGAAARLVGGGVLAGVLALGLVYPIGATWTKSNAFRGPATLDGAAFLERTRPGDAAAIEWLATRPGRPRVLEAIGGDYQEFARVSTFSGLPTVLGWVGHQLQWRGQLDEYGRRQRDVDAFYQSGEERDGLPILERYGIRYVFVGSLEREKYGRQVDERLARWLTPVFRWADAIVYLVPGASEAT